MDRAPVPTLKYQPDEGSIPGKCRKKWKITTMATTTTATTTNTETTTTTTSQKAEKKMKLSFPKTGQMTPHVICYNFFPFLQEQKKT